MSEHGDLHRLGDLLGEVSGLPMLPSNLPSNAPGEAPRSADSRPVSDRGSHAAPGDQGRQLAAIWQEVVGDEVAANAKPVQMRRGRLVVSASSSAWAQTLQLMSDAIQTSINDCLGKQVVEKIVFRHAGWEQHSAIAAVTLEDEGLSTENPVKSCAARPCSQPLSRDQEAALAGLQGLDLSPELKERIAKTMTAAFARPQRDSVR